VVHPLQPSSNIARIRILNRVIFGLLHYYSSVRIDRSLEYSGVVSLRGMRLLIFISEPNGPHLRATDVGNTYLEAVTNERLCIKAGPEFWDPAGQYLIIYNASYGLKTSGKRWYERLFDVLYAEGWAPCRAGCYGYIGVYVVDNMALEV
jgi:hypothetical protein